MFHYDFRCTGVDCDYVEETSDRHKQFQCPYCSFPMKRVWNVFSVKPIIVEPVFNPSLGTTVSSEKDMKNKFRMASDAAAERLGMDVNYQPVDLREKGSIGVTDEGLDSTYKHHHDAKVK